MKESKANIDDTASNDKWTSPKYVSDYMSKTLPSIYTHFVVDVVELKEVSSGRVSASSWNNVDNPIGWNFVIKDGRKLPFVLIFKLSIPKANISFNRNTNVGALSYGLMYSTYNHNTIVNLKVGDRNSDTTTNNADYDFGISMYKLFSNSMSYYNYDATASIQSIYADEIGSTINYFIFQKSQKNEPLWYYSVGGNSAVTSIDVIMKAKIYQYYFVE